MELHKLACRSMSLHAVPWAYIKLHELTCSFMILHAVTWACMQFLSLCEQLTRISQCLLLSLELSLLSSLLSPLLTSLLSPFLSPLLSSLLSPLLSLLACLLACLIAPLDSVECCRNSFRAILSALFNKVYGHTDGDPRFPHLFMIQVWT